MTSESGQPMVRCPWTLLLGPGASLAGCLALFETLAARSSPATSVVIEQLECWHALFCEFPEVGRILLDADSIELKDVGLLTAFSKSHPAWELWLIGSQSDDRAPRELLRLPRVRWVSGPLNVRDLSEALIAPGSGSDSPSETLVARAQSARPVESSPKRAPSAADASEAPAASRRDVPDSALDERASEKDDDLLSRVEQILRGDAGAPTGRAPASPPPRVSGSFGRTATLPAEKRSTPAPELELDESLETGPPAAPPLSHESPPAPARYFRHQIADLADLVQCVAFGLDRVAEEAPQGSGESSAAVALRLEELRSEIMRLQQFTRTLAYIASPPVQGDRRFDLAPLLEEMLTTRRSEADAPRYLLRTPDPLPILSDKQLIEQAFDALLFLAHRAAGEEGTVRVDGRLAPNENGLPEVRVSIRFPAGPLAELEPAQLLEPYALRRLLPELGANSLAAASGILQGQGGRLELHQEAAGGLEWLAFLPLGD